MPRDVVRYSIAELLHLRDSPLVHKPDGLPAVEQWMDPPADANQSRRPRSGVLADPPAIGEGRTERPIFSGAGMGNFGKRSSAQHEDTVLGPPKLSFVSASRTAKAMEGSDRRTATTDGEASLGDALGIRERWYKDFKERSREKAHQTNGRRGPGEDGEGLSHPKSRKSLNQDDLGRGHRGGDRERHPEADQSHDGPPRRPGGREVRWGRRDEAGGRESEANRFGGASGWRERDTDKLGAKVEEDPEWLDAPVASDQKQTHTQEDFQRWKERMKAKDQPVEKTEAPIAAEKTDQPAASGAASNEPAAVLPSDINIENLFGVWGQGKANDSNSAESQAKVKAKPKQSKFAGLFASAEMAIKPELGNNAQPPPLQTPISPRANANGGNEEDKEGFQRILQMLGGSSISGAPPPQHEVGGLNGMRQGAFRMDMPPQSPHEEAFLDSGPAIAPSRPYEGNVMEAMMASRAPGPDRRPSQPPFTPHTDVAPDQFRYVPPEAHRRSDEFDMQTAPMRNGSVQHDMLNMQAPLQNRANQDAGRANQREFLLTLMQQSRGTPPQGMGHGLPPRPPPENPPITPYGDFGMKAPGQSKGRLPPGIFDETRIFSDPEMMRREAEMREAEMREMAMRENAIRDNAIRERREVGYRDANMMPPKLGRPPGLSEDPAMAGLHRRNTVENIPGRAMTSVLGVPSVPVPYPPYTRNQGVPQPPQDPGHIPPPPGFGPTAMRQPPPFPMRQGPPPQMGPLSAGSTPFGQHPGMPPRMFPNQGPNPMPVPEPPQGYFPPPGFPPMGMQNRADDPRMMMGRPEFDQFGPLNGGPPRPGGRQPGMYNMP